MSVEVLGAHAGRGGFKTGDRVKLKRSPEMGRGKLDAESPDAPGHWRILFDDGAAAWHRAIEFIHAG
jgi:hypothetical protein